MSLPDVPTDTEDLWGWMKPTKMLEALRRNAKEHMTQLYSCNSTDAATWALSITSKKTHSHKTNIISVPKPSSLKIPRSQHNKEEKSWEHFEMSSYHLKYGDTQICLKEGM